MAQTIRDSQFTSAGLRLQTIVDAVAGTVEGAVGSFEIMNGSALHSTNFPIVDSVQVVVDSTESARRELPIQSGVEQSLNPVSMQASAESKAAIDSFLAPVEIDERNDPIGARASASRYRCSDKGFLSMPTAAYIELLDWTARQIVTGKRGATPEDDEAHSLSFPLLPLLSDHLELVSIRLNRQTSSVIVARS